MKRIRKREEAKFGNRVSIGGDLYESQQKFHNKVSARGEEHIAKQMQFIICPVLELMLKYSQKRMRYMPNIYLIGQHNVRTYFQVFRNLCYEKLMCFDK